MKSKYLLLFIFLIVYKLGVSQHYLGVGSSYHFSAISNKDIGLYLPQDEINGSVFHVTTKPTVQYSISANYGKQLSPKFIFFTGIQKISFGQKFDIDKTEFDDSGFETVFVHKIYESDLQLNYLKVPLKLYWKHAKDKKFGTFLSLSFDFGYLSSAKLKQNGVIYDYKEKMNAFDVNYTLLFGLRYDTDKSLYNIGIGGGDGMSDIEKKEKIGDLTPNPASNTFIGLFLSYSHKFN